jgi:hypothetical protein
MPTKLDLKKDLKHLYNPSAQEFVVVDVPSMNFLMIDGQGNPNTSPEYHEAVQALYSVAYAIKFAVKKTLGIDYPVMPLEGLWWADEMRTFSTERKDDWRWTMMIMQPDPVTCGQVESAMAQASKKKELPALPRLRLEPYHEGLSVQVLHIGPYEKEAPTLARLHNDFIPANGYVTAGKHHEIYLSDPNRVPPEKWKTVLRQPVQRA